MAGLKGVIGSMLSEKLKGHIDYYLFPQWRDSWGGAFNGQRKRQELFDALINQLKPTAIVETGTYRGTTTLYFCSTGLPIYTVEGLARNYGFAKSQLSRSKNATLLNCDSRIGLKKLLSENLKHSIHETLFFYLDAHWNEELPLDEELTIILSTCSCPIIMIDDFKVPGDPGYSYDDYGGTSVLEAKYIGKHVEQYNLCKLYPSVSSCMETGAKRGSIVLCRKREAQSLCATGLYRKH
ncbi:hypothetical protein OAM69_01555 [bacterium]|nr:hypothetical protein [bacterium]